MIWAASARIRFTNCLRSWRNGGIRPATAARRAPDTCTDANPSVSGCVLILVMGKGNDELKVLEATQDRQVSIAEKQRAEKQRLEALARKV